MALQTFSLEAVQKVRQHISAQLALPPSEQQPVKEEDRAIAASSVEPASLDALGDLFRVGGFVDEDVPAPNDEGRWFISTIDPAASIGKLPGLSLKSRVRLVTYLQRRPGGGMGVTWALPELMSTTEQLELALESTGNGAIPPHPRGALGHVMESIKGEKTPASFISASLLLRELKELGRTGSNCRWSHHRLIAVMPSKQTWQWRSAPVKDLSPKVKMHPDQSVLVEFFSCRVVPPVAIFRHLDQYVANSYRPKTHDQVIALLEKPAPTQI
ncbi:MAG: hypothetical protein F6J95_024205 [Leptolyngbya sp. SIO1E4]|nr:hypothetical protein [Leptolyngbya sp. SIO1E4]